MTRITKAILAIAFFLALTPLQAQQQFRAAWADVFNSGITSATGVTNMVNTLSAAHYNVVIFQALAYMDNSLASHGAMWKSSIVPWSSRVTASFDPLATLCTYAHSKGIEVHAWLGGSGGGPYRVSQAWPPPGNATLAAHPEWFMVPYTNSEANASNPLDGNYLLDMGSPDAQEYIISIVKELVTNYPIDGINWDDEINSTGFNQGYGYPAYSTSTYTNSGLARYRRMTSTSGTPLSSDATWSNYRRRFRNELMARSQAEIQSIKTNPRQPLRHTTAPEAYSPVPTTCTFSTTKPYADWIDWAGMLQNGWVDAVIPQTYSVSTFTNWVDKCSSCWQYSRAIFPGLGAYLNTNAANLAMLQYAYNSGLQGTSTYSYGVPNKDGSDWFGYVAANLYTNTVTTPPMPWRNPATATEGIMWGKVTDSNGTPIDDATVTVTGGSTVKTDGNGYYIATLVPATSSGTVHQLVASRTSFSSATNATATAVAADVMRYDLTLGSGTPPSITTQPQSVTATAGQSAQFTVTATGSNLGYQWRLNGTALSGATTSTLSLSNLQSSQAGSYSVVVSNSAGSVTSANATLSIVYAISLSGMGSGSVAINPSQVTYTSNSVVTVTATPNAGKKFLNWAGDVSGVVNPLSVTMNANKTIVAVFSDGVSDIIVDNSDAAASFTGAWTSSAATTPFYGTNYSFANTTTGSATSTAIYRPTIYGTGRYDVYVWFTSSGNRATNAPFTLQHSGTQESFTLDESVNGANVNGGTWTLLASEKAFSSGTNDYVYFANNAQASKVVMGDAIKWTWSAVQNTPVITNQPQSLAVNATDGAVFNAGASGESLSWSWLRNGSPVSNGANIAGATTASLTVFVASQSDAGSYTAVASNVLGTATSSAATLTVYDPPAITAQPQSDTSLQGQSVFFTVSASGSAPLSYRWRKNAANLTDGSNISGSTTSALTIRSAGPSDVASYSVIVSNMTGVAVTSSTATLTIVSNVIPLVGMISNIDGSISMTWQTDVGTGYTLQYKSNLTDLTWATLNNYTASSSTLTVTDASAAGAQRFYQLISSQRASDPAGFIKLGLLGNSDTFVSLPFARAGGTRIIVGSVSGNVVTADGSPNWTANQFVYSSGTQSNTYYARLSSGAIEGRFYQITGNTANSLTLLLGSDTLSSVAVGDAITIEPYWTLNTAFPNGAGIIASPTPGNRYTEILMPNTSGTGINLSASKIYFFNGGIWKQVADSANNHNDDILQPNSHFIIRHNVATNTTLTTLGSVFASKLAVTLRTQTTTSQDNYLGLARPVPVSLNDSGLITSGAFSASPVPGNRTDELLVFDNSAVGHNKSASADYYYWNNAWRQVGAGSTDVGANQVFQPGTAVIVRKYTNSVSPVWTNSPTW